MANVKPQDPNEVCKIFLIIHEVYSDSSFDWYGHARDAVADTA